MTSPHNPYIPPFPPSPIPPYASPAFSSTPPTHTSTSTPVPRTGYPPPQSDYPHSFSPFFTLISNPGSTVHKHPIVHYVFSDDDFDPVTETTLAAAEEAVITPTGAGPGRQLSRGSGGGSDRGGKGRETKDRVLIVDVGNDGETVVGAHSLSKEWQVVGVNISSAPQWMAGSPGDDGSGSGTGGGGASGGLMLSIEGTEVGLQAAVTKKAESVYELAEMFSERMALLKRVVEYGEKLSATS